LAGVAVGSGVLVDSSVAVGVCSAHIAWPMGVRVGVAVGAAVGMEVAVGAGEGVAVGPLVIVGGGVAVGGGEEQAVNKATENTHHAIRNM